jgi:mannose-6-phosphate isomerase-like protein (cupin superfamily)
VSEVRRVALFRSVLPNEARPIRCSGSGHVADASVHLNQVAQMPAEPSFLDPEPPATVQVVTGAEVDSVDLGSFGVRFFARAADTRGALSIVEHPIPPRTLAAPLHRHTREDEYSYVLEGRMGAVLGTRVVVADAGSLVFKPRGEWHTFWNAGSGPCRVLEIIAPGGFEEMFAEMAADPQAMTGEAAAAMDARYGLEVDYDSIPRLCEEHGLRFPV